MRGRGFAARSGPIRGGQGVSRRRRGLGLRRTHRPGAEGSIRWHRGDAVPTRHAVSARGWSREGALPGPPTLAVRVASWRGRSGSGELASERRPAAGVTTAREHARAIVSPPSRLAILTLTANVGDSTPPRPRAGTSSEQKSARDLCAPLNAQTNSDSVSVSVSASVSVSVSVSERTTAQRLFLVLRRSPLSATVASASFTGCV